MSIAWKNFGPMGGAKLMVAMRWLSIKVGRRFSRIFLYPILLYYVVFTSKGKKASRQFLEKALPYKPTFKDMLKHFFCFTSTIHDRIYMVTGDTNALDISVEGADIVFEQLKKQKGCILLGSHLGSFEILRYLAQQKNDLPLKILIDTGSTQKFNQLLYSLNPEIRNAFINAADSDSVFKVQDALNDGNIVGILGDRMVNKQRVVPCEFLGDIAPFPSGPALLGALYGAPVVLFFGVYLGGNRYKIIFELFAEKITARREHRDEDIDHWVQQYAKRLEHYTKQYPYNWFNFYDYWQEGRSS